MAKISTIEGIGPAYAVAMQAAGVATVEGLLDRGATRRGRAELAAASSLPASRILEWVNRADLMRIKGVGPEYSDLLEAAGVDTVKELRNRNAQNLTARMNQVNEDSIASSGRSLVRRTPSLVEVERWIDQARLLPGVVTH